MSALAADPHLSWDVVDVVRQVFAYPFMVNAFRAGTVVAVLAGALGWFAVLRRQTFAGHTLAVVGFPGAAGAALLGVSAAYGYFAFAVVAALVLALATGAGHGRSRDESAIVGTVLAVALACGFLFTSLDGSVGTTTALLFGSFLGITEAQVIALSALAAVVLAVLLVVGRPLLFASIDPEVARARAVPVRLLATLFLVLLGLVAAATSQITGSLLVFALLVVPAATAQQLTARPVAGLALAIGIGLVVTWASLGIAFYWDQPIGFLLTTIAFTLYVAATITRRALARS